jgi:hypothetical protein
MSNHIPPAILAEADQTMAAADGRLGVYIDHFRDHTELHNGDTLCPFAETVMVAITHDARHLPEMFAAAVKRLATGATP